MSRVIGYRFAEPPNLNAEEPKIKKPYTCGWCGVTHFTPSYGKCRACHERVIRYRQLKRRVSHFCYTPEDRQELKELEAYYKEQFRLGFKVPREKTHV